MRKKPESQDTNSVPPILSQIDTIVYVMFENRSFDNLLGWLYENDTPKNIYPKDSPSSYDGLAGKNHSLPLKPHFWNDVKKYPIQRGTGDDGSTVPNLDPHEPYPHVMNQLFGDAENTVKQPPPDGTVARMKGFLQDFNDDFETWDEALQITKTYTPDDAPVINSLAKQYAVSDRWYCSMPTNTNPNRAFSLCGTSLGKLQDGFLAIDKFETNTIFNALAKRNVEMGIYYHDADWMGEKCHTEYTFPMVNAIGKELLEIQPIDRFYEKAADGNLPAFSYIEPTFGYPYFGRIYHQGNDYHPPTDIREGEHLLYKIYTALKSNSDAWKRTLLIVTFDEHGGTYDHHPPAWGATNPGDPESKDSPFNFHLFGVRVPTLLISPYIADGTVFRSPTDVPFDSTSILATLLRWQGIDVSDADLGERVKNAPTFEGVFDSNIVNSGIDLIEPKCSAPAENELDRLLEDIPIAIRKYIGHKANNIEMMKLLAENYRTEKLKE